MEDVKRRSPVVLLAGMAGFALGAVVLGYAAMWIGISLLGQTGAGIHSDWAMAVLFGILAGFGLGGFAGAKAAISLARSRRG